jgi:hypothetical protein
MANVLVLSTIAKGIATQEGYGKTNPNGTPTRPTRNNNPGDIKSSNSTNPLKADGSRLYPVDDQNHIIYPSVDVGSAALQHQVNLMLTPGANSHFNPDMTIAQVGKLYAADPNWAAGVAKTIDGGKGVINSDTKMRDVEAYIDNGTVPPNGQLPNATANGAAQQTSVLGDVTHDPTSYVSLDAPNSSALNLAAQDIDPNLIVTEGLDEVAWFDDQGLVTGNPRIRKFVAPVAFRMLLKQPEKDGGGFTLSNPRTKEAIEVQLNASVQSFNKSSKHIYNKTNTRTGIHMTFWGMQADVIEATATTGVFMNQLGLTDFLSTSLQNAELIKLLSEGFQHTTNADTGDVQIAQSVQQTHTNGSTSAFRVAAQDAFVELLSLFKSNGNVYFRRSNYTGYLQGNDQAGVSAWSPKTGLTSQQGNSRNNDVMTRGYIAMQLKNNTYLGYFKSLEWTMDANDPFQWKFHFVFQVERTITVLQYPELT